MWWVQGNRRRHVTSPLKLPATLVEATERMRAEAAADAAARAAAKREADMDDSEELAGAGAGSLSAGLVGPEAAAADAAFGMLRPTISSHNVMLSHCTPCTCWSVCLTTPDCWGLCSCYSCTGCCCRRRSCRSQCCVRRWRRDGVCRWCWRLCCRWSLRVRYRGLGLRRRQRVQRRVGCCGCAVVGADASDADVGRGHLS